MASFIAVLGIDAVAILALPDSSAHPPAETFWSGVIVACIGAAGAVFVAWLNSRKDATVKRELKPNGGKTLRDAIDRIDRRTEQYDTRFASIDERLNTLDRSTRQESEHIIELADGAAEISLRVDRVNVDVAKLKIQVHTLGEQAALYGAEATEQTPELPSSGEVDEG